MGGTQEYSGCLPSCSITNEYASAISQRVNDLAGGSVIVQKYGDLKRGRRSTEKRIKEGFIEPTLNEAVSGDLGLVLPYNTMKSLIEMVEVLNDVTWSRGYKRISSD